MNNYTKQYFIDKLSAINEKNWTTGSLNNCRGQSCVLGHCGVTVSPTDELRMAHTDESKALIRLLTGCAEGEEASHAYKVWGINDSAQFPKVAVLTALDRLP
jgi:hypothetical protein